MKSASSFRTFGPMPAAVRPCAEVSLGPWLNWCTRMKKCIPAQTARPFEEISLIRIHVHVLYKRPEIPANSAVHAIAISVTYRKQEKTENTGSIPVSATKSFIFNHL
jgi:hypothetical protein